MTGNRSHGCQAVCSALAGGVFLLIVCCAALAQAPVGAQAPAQTERQAAFRAVSYDVYASLLPETQSLTARAVVEFESQDLSRTILCELHPNLRVSAVRDESGKVLEFDRDDRNDLAIRIVLQNAIPTGQRVKLTFDYSGPLANAENSPVSGTRMASINADSAYLLLPARWFPLTGFPSNRFTGVFHIEVPQGFVVAGTGTTEGPGPAQAIAPAATVPAPPQTGAPILAPRNRGTAKKTVAPTPLPPPPPPPVTSGISGRVQYAFKVDRPEAAGTFVAGKLQLTPVKAEGLNIGVYTSPGAAGSAEAYGDAVANIIVALSDQFGPLPQPGMNIAQLPDGSLPTFVAPGLLLVSQRQWAAKPDTRALSNLVASQWWGQEVMAAQSDAWLTDGLARYSEALYVEQSVTREAMNKALEDFAIGSLMYENKAPISEAGRLVPFSPDYTSVVVNKGALVFHMLREQLGDTAFFSLLRDFFKQYDGKTAKLADFEKMAEDRADQLNSNATAGGAGNFVLRTSTGSDAVTAGTTPAGNNTAEPINLRPFFAQWINSTGVPEFTIDYTVYRTKEGFRIDGKIKQGLDFFHMPMELEVQTEGNPEYKTVEVSGTESSFDIEVFGRPKANGILIDPRNHILKSSPALRVRAIIARG